MCSCAHVRAGDVRELGALNAILIITQLFFAGIIVICLDELLQASRVQGGVLGRAMRVGRPWSGQCRAKSARTSMHVASFIIYRIPLLFRFAEGVRARIWDQLVHCHQHLRVHHVESL